MTLRNGQCIHEYPNSNVCDGPNVSIRAPPWYDRWWAIALSGFMDSAIRYLIVIAAAILSCMYEAGCFDR